MIPRSAQRPGHGRSSRGAAASRRRPDFRCFLENLEGRALLAGGLVVGPTINVSHNAGSQSEESIAINPTNPLNVVVVANENDLQDALFLGVSNDGGKTFSSQTVATGGDGLTAACCDATVAFDSFGNLFLSYLDSNVSSAVIGLSTDGGQTFKEVTKVGSNDQPKIAIGPGNAPGTQSIWMEYLSSSNGIGAIGANITGLGQVGSFTAEQIAPSSGVVNFGKPSVGPGGQVLVSYQDNENNGGPATLFANLDPDGVGTQGFGAAVAISGTNVGGFDYISPQSSRSVDAEVALAYDNSNGLHRGRVYAIYTDAAAPGANPPTADSDNTFIMMRHSDDDGATWSAATRVTDDPGKNSKFFPRVAVDPVTGVVGAAWYDARNDRGSGSGDTDGTPNDEAEVFATVSLDGGLTFLPNVQVAAGPSNSALAGGDHNHGNDFGDYMGLAFHNGILMPSWCDNSAQLSGNPDSPNFDIATAAVDVVLLKITPQTVVASEAQPFSGTVATFTDTDPNAVASNYTVKIDWGDNTPTDVGTVTDLGGGRFGIAGSHTYNEGGTYTVGITVTTATGLSVSANGTANVADAPLIGSGVTLDNVNEGEPFTGLVATFIDTDPIQQTATSYVATIDWGDGTIETVPVTATATPNHFEVSGTHAFAADATAVTVTITDNGGATTTVSSAVVVADAAIHATGVPFSAVEGDQFSGVVASFSDDDPRPLSSAYYTATIDWGDGQPGKPDVTPGTVVVNPQGGFNVVGQHTYKIGTFNVTVAIHDADVTSATATTTATIGNAPITTQPEEIRSVEGVVFTGVVASFIDSNPAAVGSDYTATIDWGDAPGGAPDVTTGRVSFEGDHLFVVIGSHASSAGVHTVRVTIHEPAAPQDDFEIDSTNTVAAAPLTATGGPAVSGRVGVAQSVAIATFRSPNPFAAVSDFSATVKWGDNSSSDTATGGLKITRNADGSFAVSGTHTFTQVGTYPISAVITSKSGSVISAGTVATIADAPIAAVGATVSAGEKAAFRGVVASFTSANQFASAGQFSATIDWGDGTTGPGTVSAGPKGGFVVSGVHTYDQGGSYPITVAIASSGGSTASATGQANVADKLFPLFGLLNPASDSGVSAFDGITNVRQPDFVGFAEPGSTVHLFVQGAGSTLPVLVGSAVAGANGFWSGVTIALPDGAYNVFASATDTGGRPSSGVTQLLPSASVGALVIDTAGPKVAAATLNPVNGLVQVVLQDELSGLSPTALSNGAFYSLGLATGAGNQPVALTALSAASAGSSRAAVVSLGFNGGRPLGRGKFVLTMLSAGLTDLAGNALDERFFIPFPSLYGQTGNNYVAQFVSDGRSAAGPQQFVPPPEINAAAQFGRRFNARGRRFR